MKHEIDSYLYKTKDFSWFKLKTENREIKPSHVKRIEESIVKHGQIQPIVVDNSGFVYEGQHRLVACRNLGIPVKYIINTNAGLYTMQAVNSDQKSWTIKNHIEFHAKTGKLHYVKLQQLSEKYNISVNYLAEIAGSRNNEVVRQGEFESNRWELVEEFLDFHQKVRPHIKRSVGQGFINGVFFIWCLDKIDHNRLFQKLFEHRESLDEFNRTMSQTKEKVIEIYNENLKSENKKILYFYNSKKEIEFNEKFVVELEA